MSAQHGCAGKMHFTRLEHDSFVQRQASASIVLAEEDAKQDGVARHLHGQTHFIALRLAAATWPIQTASIQPTTEIPILPPARAQSPSIIKFSVCRLNDENVVYPPHNPIMTNCRW